MKKGNIIMNILFIGLIILCGCTKKNVEGVVISVPAYFGYRARQATKDAGLIAVAMGIETGNEYIRKKIFNRNTPSLSH